MVRRTSVGVFLAAIVLLGSGIAAASPITLARHPDYNAGRIAFSHLGDIWVVSEGGTGAHRVTDHLARELYPRFSPDGDAQTAKAVKVLKEQLACRKTTQQQQ